LSSGDCFRRPNGRDAGEDGSWAGHRTAKLSKGWIKNGHIVCGYHGWEYDRSGKLTNIPQFPFEQAAPDARARSFHAKTRYGYVWVCLSEPIDEIPDLPYEEDLSFRRIHQIDDYGDGLRKSASSCAILRGKRARRGVVRGAAGALFYCGG
jgi:phenylpropionate dioxygenase-like ring-hydroxylating dioxygenase large terminal subunit